MKAADFQTQGDSSMRCVTLANLLAMCERVSGMCHRYTVDSMSFTGGHGSVRVSYSNPDEYGSDDPITAVFPAFRNDFEESNPWIVIGHFLRVLNDRDGYGYQAFDALCDGPQLWRSRANASDWATREEIEAKQAKEPCSNGHQNDGDDTCAICGTDLQA